MFPQVAILIKCCRCKTPGLGAGKGTLDTLRRDAMKTQCMSIMWAVEAQGMKLGEKI